MLFPGNLRIWKEKVDLHPILRILLVVSRVEKQFDALRHESFLKKASRSSRSFSKMPITALDTLLKSTRTKERYSRFANSSTIQLLPTRRAPSISSAVSGADSFFHRRSCSYIFLFIQTPLLLLFGAYYITIPRPLATMIYTIPRPLQVRFLTIPRPLTLRRAAVYQAMPPQRGNSTYFPFGI